MITIRFNLRQGKKYYKKWKVEDLSSGEIRHIDPKEKSLIMSVCTLKNRRKKSDEIYQGSYKDVCSWVICERCDIVDPMFFMPSDEIMFNPRLTPFWISRKTYENLDKCKYDKLMTFGKSVFSVEVGT